MIGVKRNKKLPDKNGLVEQGNILQDIWQRQMLRLRSVPVSIIPESAKIVGEKLYLTVDENDKNDKIIDEISTTFNLPKNEINVENGCFFADNDVANSVDKDTKRLLSERAAANFINFLPFPIIDGYIRISNPISSQVLFFCLKNYPIYTLVLIKIKIHGT
jgi:hypothetical protein